MRIEEFPDVAKSVLSLAEDIAICAAFINKEPAELAEMVGVTEDIMIKLIELGEAIDKYDEFFN